jgi:hypothetical protein
MATYSFDVFNTISISAAIEVEADSFAHAVRLFSTQADLKTADWEANWSDRDYMAGVESITREDDGVDDPGALTLSVLWLSDRNDFDGFNPEDVLPLTAEMDATVERLMLETNTAPATSTCLAQRL